MKKVCLLWDFDATLGYRDGMWTVSLSNVLERNGYKGFDRQLISDTMNKYYPWAKSELAHDEYFNGMGWWEYIEKCVAGAGLSAIGIEGAENARIASQFREEYLRLDAWHLFSDTKINLERAVNAGYDNAILSNHTPELRLISDYLNISQYFKHIVTSADVGYEKPHSKFFDVIKTFGDYDDYYMIGDNYHADILGAIDYGIKAVMVRKPNDENHPCYSKDLSGIWNYIE